jgi:hypothetical protein
MTGQITGQELRQLILDKWGHSYDVQFRRTQGRIWLQVMWRYQEQRSFPLTEVEYLEHLQAISIHLNEWGAVAQVQGFIQTVKSRPRLGKAVCIPLDLNLGSRSVEWLLDE